MRIAAATGILVRMYDRIADDVPEAQIMRFDEAMFVGADQRKWGISPFHYIDDYYHCAADQLALRRAIVAI